MLIVFVGMTASGLVFGIVELEMVGLALGVLVGLAALNLRLRTAQVVTERRIHPAVTRVGGEVAVEVDVKRVASRTPLVGTDSIPRFVGPSVRLTIEPAKGVRRAKYRFQPRMRGIHRVGPLNLVQTDPLGAVQRSVDSAGHSKLVVLPSFETLATLPGGVQRLGIVKHSPQLGQGEEFYAMREYIAGDDLRKIHWSTSARLGKLVIRENELMSEPVCIILLDTQASKHRGEGPDSSLEAAVSAAASVADLAVRNRIRLRIITPAGSLLDSERAPHLDVMTTLAGVTPTSDSILTALPHTGRTFANVLVVITPGLSATESGQLATLAAPTSAGVVVAVVSQSWVENTRPRQQGATALGLPLIRLHKGEQFRGIWEKGVTPRVRVRS